MSVVAGSLFQLFPNNFLNFVCILYLINYIYNFRRSLVHKFIFWPNLMKPSNGLKKIHFLQFGGITFGLKFTKLSGVPLEKQLLIQLQKKFLTFSGTRRFIIMFESPICPYPESDESSPHISILFP